MLSRRHFLTGAASASLTLATAAFKPAIAQPATTQARQ